MAREPIPTWFFAVVVVRHAERFLLVHERKHGQLWYLPAGRVEPGETFADAAVRETLEETGVWVTLEGVLRIEHTPRPTAARMRVVFVARPEGDPTPKSEPDEESLGAAWVTLEEARGMELRGPDVLRLIEAAGDGAPAAPLSLLTHEGA